MCIATERGVRLLLELFLQSNGVELELSQNPELKSWIEDFGSQNPEFKVLEGQLK